MSSEARLYAKLRRAVPPGGDGQKIVRMINGFPKEDKMGSVKLVIV